MEEYVNKLVITCKNPKRKAKLLCKQLRRLLLPNVTYKLQNENISAKKYKEFGDELKISHFIVVGNNYIKIGERPTGPTLTYSIEEYNEKINAIPNLIYGEDPLITISGESEYSKIFESLTCPGTQPKRNIHLHFEGNEMRLRHYKIETEEDEDIKVGLTEIGPRLTLKLKKCEEGFFDN